MGLKGYTVNDLGSMFCAGGCFMGALILGMERRWRAVALAVILCAINIYLALT